MLKANFRPIGSVNKAEKVRREIDFIIKGEIRF